MTTEVSGKSLKATWSQALWSFLWPVLAVLTVRWAIAEPFVIPSGSMIPNLLVHDHIFVSKFSYGLSIPFTKKSLVTWSQPRRGDIVVFRFPDNPDVYYIKRLIGLPKDKIKVVDGVIQVNSQDFNLKPFDFVPPDSEFKYFEESNGQKNYVVRFLDYDNRVKETQEITVREGHYFFMGDNRDQSNDSRYWGQVPEANVVGKAQFIWLSCDSTLESAPYLCDPSQIRWKRLFTWLK